MYKKVVQRQSRCFCAFVNTYPLFFLKKTRKAVYNNKHKPKVIYTTATFMLLFRQHIYGEVKTHD